MRGARKDVSVSKLLYKNGIFLDRRSFVSLNANEPHLFLFGDDIKMQRERVWARSKGKCGICKKKIEIAPYEGQFDFGKDWEMDHIQGGLVGRCDCLHNLRATHPECHRAKHVRPRFGERAQAVKDFDKVNPREAT